MEAVFLRVLNMSLAAADVIGVVVLVRLLLRRAPKKEVRKLGSEPEKLLATTYLLSSACAAPRETNAVTSAFSFCT